ncbi:hypothetical protein ACPXCE_08810 [Streptomyces sp. DT24]|uniref:hypothetical protein n=1 Tax=unclassified Streptomyces TaxID=2593676 RepID=UPI0023B8BDCF|nr:hypothetical protein [Streptomyces sp. AM 4-1-1]WEH33544.1 hypothetical protein PZB75_09245 [Streptomyces sp. AM 4-1-1]
MSTAWLHDETPLRPGDAASAHGGVDICAAVRERPGDRTAQVTASGAAWLATATAFPRSTLSRWEASPGCPAVLPCGSVFDVVNVPALLGRHMLEHLWTDGPGSGPVATHRGRMLLFAAPGTAQRLPSLLDWEEWGSGRARGTSREDHRVPGPRLGSLPPLLCHGTGDAVTVPPLACGSPATGPRWVVAPDTRTPWLPGPDVLLWACVRVARSTPPVPDRISIFPPADPDANVYDVSRRR